MGYFNKSANMYVNYDLDDLVTETIKSNQHQKVANFMEILKVDGLPDDVVQAISAEIVTYVRTATAK